MVKWSSFDFQIIEKNGKPEWVMVPYEEYQREEVLPQLERHQRVILLGFGPRPGDQGPLYDVLDYLVCDERSDENDYDIDSRGQVARNHADDLVQADHVKNIGLRPNKYCHG